jgi:tryptophan halogenase
MTTDHPVRRVLIVGGGTAGWMAAASLSKLIGRHLDITLVESDEIGTIGVGEATIPTFIALHQLLKIPEAEFLASVQGTIKLGISFERWQTLTKNYIHAFGTTGQGCWAAGFHHFWNRANRQGFAGDYGLYSPELMAAQAGRFGHLQNTPLNYAYHLDATAYARYLRTFSEKAGVRRIEGRIDSVKLNASGNIDSVQLVSGAAIDADLFIDCSGFTGLLIDKALNTPFDDWGQWLPCDRAIAVQTSSVESPIPYTRAIAHGFGWQWKIPLQHRVGNGLVFSSEFMTDDQAADLLLNEVTGDVLTEPRVIRFKTGQRKAHWVRNCVAIGLASGFIEPMESTSIHLIQRGIIRLMQLFPYGGIQEGDRSEFNEQMTTEFRHIRDFIIMHYHLTERTDTEFWRRNQAMSVPDSLSHRLELFAQSGNVFQGQWDVFGENSWTQVMMGQGLRPAHYHPIVDMMSDNELKGFIDHQAQKVQSMLARAPKHADFLKAYCPAPLP